MIRPATAALALLLATAPVTARSIRPAQRPAPASLLAAPPIMPGGTLIRDGERLRTLELDDLAALRLRWVFRF